MGVGCHSADGESRVTIDLDGEEQEALVEALAERAENVRDYNEHLSEFLYGHAYDIKRGATDGTLEVHKHDVGYIQTALARAGNAEESPAAAHLYIRLNEVSPDPARGSQVKCIRRTAAEYDQ